MFVDLSLTDLRNVCAVQMMNLSLMVKFQLVQHFSLSCANAHANMLNQDGRH